MQRSKEIIFAQQNLPSGSYKLLFGIDDNVNTNLIINPYDSDFDYLAGYVLHWTGYSGGATVSQEFNMLKVHTDALLSDAYFRDTVIGKRYKITTRFLQVSGFSNAPVNIYVGGVLIGSTSNKTTEVEFIFTATTSTQTILLSSTQDFYCDYITVFNVELATAVSIGDIKIGNNNDVDWVMYPGVFEFSFKVAPDNTSGYLNEINKWNEIDFALRNYYCNVQLYKLVEGVWELWIYSTIDKADIGSNVKEKVFNVRTLDWMTYLKLDRYVNPSVDPATYTLRKLSTIIQFLYDNAAIPSGIEFVSDWVIMADGTGIEHPIEDLYLNRVSIEFGGQPFTTRGDVLKGIMNNLASYMIAGFNKNIIMPLEYNGGDIHTLYLNEMPPLEIFSIGTYQGLNFTEHNGSGVYNAGDPTDGYLDVNYPFPCSQFSDHEGSLSTTLYLNDDKTGRLLVETAKYRQRDGTYSAADSFTMHCNSIINGQINHARLGLIAKLQSVDVPQNKFFEIRYSRTNATLVFNAVFRAKQFLISVTNNRTSLWLVEC